MQDPDRRVAGQGHRRLRDAGIVVEIGPGADEALRINQGFFKRLSHKRPFFELKLATSLDAKTATAAGESKWITGQAARDHANRARAVVDAIMIGSSTALMDDPQLTCRMPGLEDRSPVSIIVDSRLRLPMSAKVVRSASRVPTLVLTDDESDPVIKHALSDAGVTVISLPGTEDESLDPAAVADALFEFGLTRVLIEGGARLATAYLEAGMVDMITWYRAPMVLGGDGLDAVGPIGIGRLGEAMRLRRRTVEALGDDLLETYDVLA